MPKTNHNLIINSLSKGAIRKLNMNISYSIRDSQIKKIGLQVDGYPGASQTDFFVITQILLKEFPEFNLSILEPQYIPLYDLSKKKISNTDIAKKYEISNITYNIGGVECTIQT